MHSHNIFQVWKNTDARTKYTYVISKHQVGYNHVVIQCVPVWSSVNNEYIWTENYVFS